MDTGKGEKIRGDYSRSMKEETGSQLPTLL